ncbi:MAG TPA: biotin/lipoyl-containing protein [Thermoplasmata archaeon]|nr:biotin/lipoyl-containing protein [Thermoplasmata archaeon]
MRFRLVVDGEAREIEAVRRAAGVTLRVDGIEYRADAKESKGNIIVRIGSQFYRIRFSGSSVFIDGEPHAMSVPELGEEPDVKQQRSASRNAAAVEVRSPMPGRVVRLSVRVGSHVKRGQTLAVLEAMKMQNEIPAPSEGTVREVRVAEGESITADRVVAVIASR